MYFSSIVIFFVRNKAYLLTYYNNIPLVYD